MKCSLFLVILLCFYATLTSAETKIYHWVDADGKTHFADTAPPGTAEIVVKNKNLVSTPEQQPKKINNTSSNKEEIIKYQAEITTPKDDVAIRSNNGTLEVHVKTTPEKKSTQRLQLFLDGQALGLPQISPTIRALNIDRGTHQIQAKLLDEGSNILATTQVVTIHLQRISVIK
ncbi:DUF4124 domain-containing protein [uncultured Psychromonas sp.]|uniref:DUF4124 domain-containing protein n=1 Tax=uncultured Psychromonas sp. TaxID=173974 RepID=UPI002625FB03|nr:DUF4124 domain-containing protein [uncultured Psychromonas sp.]